MSKFFKRLISLCLAVVMLITIAGCKKKPSPPVDEDITPPNQIADTNIDFVKNNASEYKIVISQNASQQESYAAGALQKYVLDSTKATLAIITDQNIGFDENAKHISLGNTSILAGSGVGIDSHELNGDGYKLLRKGNTVVCAGGTDTGTIYAANEFAKLQLGYAFYAVDETDYQKLDNVKLKDFNVTEIPDFAERTSYYRSMMVDNTGGDLRLRADKGTEWGLAHHSFFILINPDIYLAEHKDWFSPDKHQLCLTNNQMKAELIKNLKQTILDMPDKKYFMIGQSDMYKLCNCNRVHNDGEMTCAASNKQYGTSGTIMRFVNSVAREIKSWQKDACPQRELFIGVFAYQDTKLAPVTYNKVTGEYVPVDSSVVAEDNVIVRYAPLEACYSHPLTAACNSVFANAINGWQAITNNFAIWSYCTYFSNFLVHFNNWSTIQANYKIYKDMGATIVLDQGAGTETQATPMEALRIYLQTQLLWNVDQDVNKLIDDFITHYYKSAAKYVKEYLDLTREHYLALETDWKKEGKQFCSKVTINYEPAVLNEDVFPHEFLLRQQETLNKALAEVEKEENLATRELLHRRVLAETLSPRAMILDIHYKDYSKAQLAVMLDEFEDIAGQVGLKNWSEYKLLGIALSELRVKFELDIQ